MMNHGTMANSYVRVVVHDAELQQNLLSDLTVDFTSVWEKKRNKKKKEDRTVCFAISSRFQKNEFLVPAHYSFVFPVSGCDIETFTVTGECMPHRPVCLYSKSVSDALKELNFSRTLTSYQLEAMDALEKNNGHGVLKMATGSGKTEVAIAYAVLHGVRTIVVVNNTELFHQWIDRIRFCVPWANVGRVKESICECGPEVDFVVVMLQTVYSDRRVTNADFATFGTTIIDEVPSICSQQYSHALWKVCTKRSIGLSATPYRQDGFHRIAFWFMGNIVYEFLRDYSNVDLFRLQYNELHKERKVAIRKYPKPQVFTLEEWDKIPSARQVNMEVDFVTTTTLLCEDSIRNQAIVKWLVYESVQQNRRVLAIGERVRHLRVLHDFLVPLLQPSGKTVGIFVGKQNRSNLSTSTMATTPMTAISTPVTSSTTKEECEKTSKDDCSTKKRKRPKKKEDDPTVENDGCLLSKKKGKTKKEKKLNDPTVADVVLTTYALSSVGLNFDRGPKPFETLFQLTPKKSAEQFLGRLVRGIHTNGNRYRVYDIVDECSVYDGMYWSRHKVYVAGRYRMHPMQSLLLSCP